mgnify:FL=1
MKATYATIQALIRNMSQTGDVLYTEMFQDMILSKMVDQDMLDDLMYDKEKLNEIVQLDSNLALILMDLCTIFRAELIAENVIEKRFLLKRVIMICHEGHKYLFGFNQKTTTAVRFLNSINEKEQQSVNAIRKAAADYGRLYGTETYKKIRDVSKHFSYDSLEFYSCIKDLTEGDVSDLMVKFIAYAHPLHRLVNLVLSKVLGNELYVFIRSQKALKQTIPNIFNDLNIERIVQCIAKYGNIIERLNSMAIGGTNLLKKADIDPENESLRPFFKDNIGLHIFYIIVDVMCALKAFSNSKDFYEQSIHLAFIQLSVHEGLKKLYGFNSNDQEKSFWNRIKEDFSSVLSLSKDKLNQITENLQKLSSSEYVSSEEVVIFTHYGENKHHNIPFSVITFFFRNTRPQNFSTLIEVIKTLNSILPLVSELMENENQRKNEEINRKFEEMHTNIIDSISKSRTKAKPEMQKKLDDLTKDISEINDQIRNYFH